MTDEIINNLGPLAPLAGIWEGDKGDDTAPSKSRGTETNKFRERITFEPMGPVNNHEQMLYGLRYSTTAWPSGSENPFHEELGYWMWDADAKQVMRCFMVPRIAVINAGGNSEADAKEFELKAEVGSSTFGIMSNPYLDKAAKSATIPFRDL